MNLNLPKKIWVYVERLYITCYDTTAFKKLLRKFDIQYDNKLYRQLKTIDKPFYVFMSNEDYTFADFMQSVPSDKYLQILEPIVFDDKIIATQRDNWNFYGESIKRWYPIVTQLLSVAGVGLDKNFRKLVFKPIASGSSNQDFLAYSFNDPFLDYIRKEANDSYQQKHFLSVMFLSRKILEVCIVRLFEVVFPKIVRGNYNADNHSLWFDTKRNSFRSFDSLLDNLKVNAAAFHEDKDLVLQLCALVKPFKDETNSCVHDDYKIPDPTYLSSWRIDYLISLARKLYLKYCKG
jgi:hypothetical protein